MRKRLALIFATAALSVGSLAAPASAGTYCENLDGAGAGDACRTAVGAALTVCNKAAGVFGNECGLG